MSESTGQTVAMAETETAASLDDETNAALTLFNEYVAADRERTRREKHVKKAERAKDEAAARVKKLAQSGSAEEKAEAEAAYREASEAWRRIRDGEESAAAEAPAAEETPAEDTPAEETAAAASPAEDATTETDRTDDDAEDAAGEAPVTGEDTAQADSADESE